MTKQKKKLSHAQKAAKKKRQEEYMTIFVNGKQKRVKRPVAIDGMDVDEFIRRNADPIWLHQNEMWEYMDLTEDDDPFSFDEFDEKGKKPRTNLGMDGEYENARGLRVRLGSWRLLSGAF